MSFAEHRSNKTTPSKKVKHKPAHSFVLNASKIAAVVVLTLLLSFSLMIGVQALGIDMFGALARWTNDTFHFETQPTEHDSQNDLYDSVQAMLNVQGILGELAPKWYPEGSEITKYILQDDEFGFDTRVSFTAFGGKNFYIRVSKFSENEDIDSILSERNSDFREEYIAHDKLFYLLSNEEYLKGIWSDGRTVLSIRGNLSVQELKKMIDSIGG